MRRVLLFTLIASVVLCCGAATAAARTPSLKSLAKTVAKLQKKVNAQAKTITALKGRVTAAETAMAGLQNSAVMALNPFVTVTAAGGAGAINGVTGPSIVLQGCNLQLKSATAQDDTSGTGNLIVGWNRLPTTVPTPFRSGSNNLIVGDQNNFTSFGCFLAGANNTAGGACASVSGGSGNTAAAFSSVSGGSGNTASGFGSVSGGTGNTANGGFSSVGGGAGNTAAAGFSTVSGGSGITNNNSFGWWGGTYHSP
jgi:hypothetical protein